MQKLYNISFNLNDTNIVKILRIYLRKEKMSGTRDLFP